MQYILKRKERAALQRRAVTVHTMENTVEETKAVGHGTAHDNMKTIENATSGLASVILDSDEYKAYSAELEKINRFPEIKAQVDDFRKRNYILQTESEIDFKKLDEFEKEYQSIRENPLVADFLAAELDLCRLVQRVQLQLISALHFE